MFNCPCGSGRDFTSCCGPLLQGVAQAYSAEQLMRSRYTAYTLGDQVYLEQTWHASTRPVALQLDDEPRPRWQKLMILHTSGGRIGDSEGTVEFLALYLLSGRSCQLRESSRFVRAADDRWYYLDGVSGPAIGRNAPCPCGSGRKFKRCCGK